MGGERKVGGTDWIGGFWMSEAKTIIWEGMKNGSPSRR